MIFAVVIHAISKEEWENWRVVINRAENMEGNERLINCQNYAATSHGTISVLQIPAEINPSLHYHVLLSRRLWSDVIGLCHICDILLPQKD